MTAAALTAASRRRRLVTWAAGVLVFHTAARHREGQDRLCRLIDAVTEASDEEVAQATPRLAMLLQAETGMLTTRGEA